MNTKSKKYRIYRSKKSIYITTTPTPQVNNIYHETENLFLQIESLKFLAFSTKMDLSWFSSERSDDKLPILRPPSPDSAKFSMFPNLRSSSVGMNLLNQRCCSSVAVSK